MVTVKFAALAPGGIVTLAGTLAAPLLLDKTTIAPPDGAGPFKVTFPEELLPPVNDAGFSARLASTGGLMVSVADCVPL